MVTAVLFSEGFLRACYDALGEHGVLIQQSESPLLHAQTVIKPLQATLGRVGFSQRQTVQFPQPSYPSGWWSATLGYKGEWRREVSEEALAGLSLRYLNRETYVATQALPAFMR